MKTPISYYGGKQTMLKHIIPLIPEHSLYTESFCGGAAVLFAKNPVKAEIINDINGELVNFYIVAKSDFDSLKKRIDSTLHSRELHLHAHHIYMFPQYFTPIERAWALWVCSKMSFASMLDSSFGYDRNGTTTLKIYNAKENFCELLKERLERVTIERDNAIKVIKRYDIENAFHFVDPPYINSDCGHYANSFNESDFEKLLTTLANIKGKFMLTMFPHTSIAEYADRHGWNIHKVERTISASVKNRRKQEEWIIVNYTI